jgi:hypothetical protein
MRTLTRHLIKLPILGIVAAAGCGNESARAPNPPRYEWPDNFAYRLQYVEAAQSGAGVVSRLDETATLRFAVRNDRYLAWNDSVVKTRLTAGLAPEPEALSAEDTLRYLVRLGRLGESADVEPDCDPTVGACAAAFPSALPLELRRIIPHLPIWWPPRGQAWADTLVFDDLPRPGAARGTVLTVYRVTGDTTFAGRRFWIIGWRSTRRAWRPAGATLVPDPETQEYGDVLVNKATLLPAYAQWYGALLAPPELRSLGVRGTGYRGRAWLAGGVFDSLGVSR